MVGWLLDRVLGKEELEPWDYRHQHHDAKQNLEEFFETVRMTQYADGTVVYECKNPKQYMEEVHGT